MIICNYIDYKTLNNSSQKISTNNNNIYYSTKNNFLIYTTNIDISNSPLTDYFKINVFKENNLYYQIPIRYDNCISNTSNNYPLVMIDDNNYFVTKIATLGSFSSTETNTNFPCGIVNIDFYIISLKEDGYEIVNSWNNLKFLGEKANNYCLNCDYYKIISLIYSEKIERYVGFFMLTKITNTDLKIFLIVTMNENQNQLIENIYIYNLNLTNVKDINKIDGTNYIYFIYPDENKILILDLEKNYLSDNPGVFIKLNINLNSIPTEVIYNSEYDVFLISNKLLDKIFIHIFKLNKDRTGILNEYGIYDIIIPDNISGNRVTSLLFTYPFLTTCIINQCIVFKLPNFPKLDSFSIYDIYSINNQSNNQINTTITKLYPVYNNFTINLYIAGYYYSQSYVTSFIGKINDCIFLNSEISNRCSTECLTGEYNKDKTCRYTFSNCNKIINNGQCIDYCNNKLLKYQSLSYCLDKCPIGYYDYNNNCISVCPDNTFIYNYRCYDKCPDYTFIYNNICLDTCNLVDENTNPLTCLDICEKYILIRPQYSSCVDSCPVGYTIKDNKCIECRDCNTCPLYNQIIQDNNRINCLYCKTINKYYFNGKCIDYIPSIPYINLLDQNAILHCYELNKYISNNKCVSECPPDEYPNRQYKCVNKNQGYLYLGYIVDKCPIGYGITDDKKCENCIDRYIFNNKCITQCPELYYQSDNNQCVHCSKQDVTKKSFIQVCLTCKHGYFNLSYECIECKDDEFLFDESNCVNVCSITSSIDIKNKKCTSCDKNGKFLFNNQCVQNCPNKTKPSSDNICISDNPTCENLSCNDGECILTGTNAECKCKPGKTGKNCELSESYIVNFNNQLYNSLNNTKNITEEYINNALNNLTYSFGSDKELFNKNADQMIDILLNVLDTYSNKTDKFTESINKLIDKVMDFNSNTLSKFDQLMTKLKKISDINISDLIKKYTYYFSDNSNFKITIFDSNNPNATKLAQENNLAIINMTECESIIRNKLKIPTKDPIHIKKIEYTEKRLNGSQQDSESKIIEYFVYDNNGKKLKIEEECGSINIDVLIPIDKRLIEIEQYEKFISLGYNIYDLEGPFFDICSPVIDEEKGVDIPLSTRKKNFTVEIKCGDKCKFAGFDPKTKYAICTCQNTLISNQTIANAFTDSFKNNNLVIFKCYENVIGDKVDWTNFSYYLGLAIFILTILCIIICYFADSKRKNYIRQIFKKDGQIYHPDLVLLEEYILYLTQNYNKTVLKKDFLKNLGKKLIKIKDEKSIYNDSLNLANENIEEEKINNNKNNLSILNKETLKQINTHQSNELENGNRSGLLLKSNKFKFFQKETLRSNLHKRIQSSRRMSIRMLDSAFIRNKVHKKTSFKNKILFIGDSKDSKSKINISVKEMEKCVNYQMSFSEISSMEVEEMLIYDRRGHFKFLWDTISQKHDLIQTFFVISILEPRFMKIILFYLQISLQFMFNAIFYSDDLIEARNNKFSNEIEKNATFNQKIVYEINTFPEKILPSIFLSICVNFILKFILMTPSDSTKRLFNERIISRNENFVKFAINDFRKSMTIKYIFFVLISFLLFLLSFYYLVAFCSIYERSAENCIISGFISLLISSTIEPILIPIFHTFCRFLAKLWPNRLFKLFYYICNKFL